MVARTFCSRAVCDSGRHEAAMSQERIRFAVVLDIRPSSSRVHCNFSQMNPGWKRTSTTGR